MASALSLVVAAAVLVGALGLLTRGRRPGARGLGVRIGAAAVAAAAVVAIAGVSSGLVRLHGRHPIAPTATLPAADVARGERLAHLCADCHADDGTPPLAGGSTNFSPPLGDLYAPNLTPAGRIASWSDEQLIAAIRHGVDAHGKPLLIMPSETYAALTDRDAAALVAYLRAQPAVANDVPPRQLNPLGLAVVGFGIFPTSVERVRQAGESTPTTEGAYVAAIAGCASCHGDDLAGGDPDGFVPAGPGLRRAGHAWSAHEFVATLRTGVTPDGRSLDDERMPWRTTASAFTDAELRALHAHVRETTRDETGDDATGGDAPARDAAEGARIYAQRCSACHGTNGDGSVGPALRANRRLGDADFVLRRVLDGGRGMPAWANVLDDHAIAAVASHVRASWGNDHDPIDASDVARARR